MWSVVSYLFGTTTLFLEDKALSKTKDLSVQLKVSIFGKFEFLLLGTL